MRRYRARELREEGVQTDKVEERVQKMLPTNRSANTSPSISKQNENKLLEKISVL